MSTLSLEEFTRVVRVEANFDALRLILPRIAHVHAIDGSHRALAARA